MKHNQRMQHFSRLFRSFFADERGQSTTEYILILFVVVLIAMKFKSTFLTKLQGIIGKVGQGMDDATSDSLQ